MKHKITLQDIKSCFYGVPKNIYTVCKDENKHIHVTTSPDIHKHYYAIQKLKRRYNLYQETPLSNTYIITSAKEA